jgi:TonB family protein
MTITIRHLLLGLALLSVTVCAPIWAQQAAPAGGAPPATLLNEEFKLASFTDLDYPPVARRLKVQGAVVVWVTLDDDGRVTAATAVSGPKVLVESAVANARTWRFHPNPRHSAVIVYDFSINEGACHNALKSLFLLKHPNLATITTCSGVIEG